MGGRTQHWMACIHIKNYSEFKYYIHPNIKHTINHYKKGNEITTTIIKLKSTNIGKKLVKDLIFNG